MLKNTWVVLAVVITLTSLVWAYPQADFRAAGSELLRSPGPIVNQSVIPRTYVENFGAPESERGSVEGEQVVNLSRVFYDPHHTISRYLVDYPPEFTSKNAPILCDIINSPGPRFGYVSLYTSWGGVNFNSRVYYWQYGKTYYNITITAVNATGASSAILKIYIEDINDPPVLNESYSFYEARIMEDNVSEEYNLSRLFYDKYDPWDTQYLTFSYRFKDENFSRFIDITILDTGVVRIAPAKDWNGHTKVVFTATDPGGLSVSKELIITVVGVNDPPIFPPVPDVYVMEGEKCEIHFNASDPADGDQITYSTNALQVITPLNFGYNYYFHKYYGIMSFDTDNDLVGNYSIWVRADDGNGSYVQRNFTIHIINVNQPPTASIASPGDGDSFGSLDNITLRGVVEDPDLIHNDTINMTWYLDGKTVLGYGPELNVTVSEPGYHNITLVAVDSGGLESRDTVRIRIIKSVVYGEKFVGQNLDQSYTDERGDEYSFFRGAERKEVKGVRPSVDLVQVVGRTKGQTYEIVISFAGDLNFVRSGSKTDEPYLFIYFVKPGHREENLTVGSSSTRPTFYSPRADMLYVGIKFDLYTSTFVSLPRSDVHPSASLSGRTVKVTITFRDLDLMGVEPDFRLFVTTEMRESILDPNGNIIISTYDSIGEGAVPTPEPPSVGGGGGAGGGGGGSLLIGLGIAGAFGAVAVLSYFFIFAKKKKKKETLQPTPATVPPPAPAPGEPLVDFNAIQKPQEMEAPSVLPTETSNDTESITDVNYP